MNEWCNDKILDWELLGRVLNESSQINKRGLVKDKAMYPKISYPDREPGREKFFSNKLSVVRLCRSYNDEAFSWKQHVDRAKGFIARTDNVFRGFLIGKVHIVKTYGLDIVADGNEKNPYHAHIIIPDFNENYVRGITMISDVMPDEIRERLDRLRKQMTTVILNRGEKYPSSLNYASPSETICNVCRIN